MADVLTEQNRHLCLSSSFYSVLTPIKMVENIGVKELLDIISVLFIHQLMH